MHEKKVGNIAYSCLRGKPFWNKETEWDEDAQGKLFYRLLQHASGCSEVKTAYGGTTPSGWADESVKALFVDECSMVARAQWSQADFRLKQAKRKLTQIFGGIGLVTCGDLLQLPPVGKASVCDPPPENSDKVTENQDAEAQEEEREAKKKNKKGGRTTGQGRARRSRPLADFPNRGDFAAEQACYWSLGRDS